MQDRPTKTKPDLFTPIEVGPLKCPNRIVMDARLGNPATTLTHSSVR